MTVIESTRIELRYNALPVGLARDAAWTDEAFLCCSQAALFSHRIQEAGWTTASLDLRPLHLGVCIVRWDFSAGAIVPVDEPWGTFQFEAGDIRVGDHGVLWLAPLVLRPVEA